MWRAADSLNSAKWISRLTVVQRSLVRKIHASMQPSHSSEAALFFLPPLGVEILPLEYVERQLVPCRMPASIKPSKEKMPP
jgi:hypothetical protein